MDHVSAELVIAVVPPDMADAVLRAASRAGATGATRWRAHGTGVEHETLFDVLFRFSPEREVVAVVTPTELAEAVFDAVRTSVPVDHRGVGFVASVELASVAGIRNVIAA